MAGILVKLFDYVRNSRPNSPALKKTLLHPEVLALFTYPGLERLLAAARQTNAPEKVIRELVTELSRRQQKK